MIQLFPGNQLTLVARCIQTRGHPFRFVDADVDIKRSMKEKHGRFNLVGVLQRRPCAEMRALPDEIAYETEIAPVAVFFLESRKIGNGRNRHDCLEYVRIHDG